MSPRKPTPKSAPARKRPRCSRCDRWIYVPPEWSMGAAVRRHYWVKHREVMMGTPQGPS